MTAGYKKIVFIAGGGSGGHIYPGVAVARALEKLDQNCEVHFVGTREGMEQKILEREKICLHLIQGGKINFSGNPLIKIASLLKLPVGFFQAIFLLLKYRPICVLGVGGYASVPMVLAAAFLRFNTSIWDPNAHPGLANRFLSKFVKRCFVVFDEAKLGLKSHEIINYGMPVRPEITSSSSQERTNQKFHLFSFGGSQGARAISTVLCQAILNGGDWLRDLEIVHQIGALDFQIVSQKYKGHEKTVTPFEFIFEMPKYYQWADLALCRGGASTITELAAFGVVPIIIPLPGADGHQRHNAESLVKANAGVMILQEDFTTERLVKELTVLRNDPEKRKSMAANLEKFFDPLAAQKIAKDLLEKKL